MSQKNVDFMKKNKYQFKKQITPPDDYESIRATQEIFNAQMDGTETFLDADMPIDPFDTTVDWSVGAAPNDEIFKVVKNKHATEEDLDSGVYEPIKDLSGLLPYGRKFDTRYYDFIFYDNKMIFCGVSGVVHYYDFFTEEFIDTGSTGPVNDGSATGLFDAYFMFLLGDLLIIVGESDKIATYDFSTDTWNAHNSGAPYTNSVAKTGVGGFLVDAVMFETTTLVLSGKEGIASYDENGWVDFEGTGTGTGPWRNIGWFTGGEGPGDFHSFKMIEYNDTLVCTLSSGVIFSYDGSDWQIDGGQAGTGIYGEIPPPSTSASFYPWIIEYGTQLLFISGGDNVSSWDGTNWKYWDGSGTGTGLNLTFGDNSSGGVLYNNDLIFFNGDSSFYYDGTTWFEDQAAQERYTSMSILGWDADGAAIKGKEYNGRLYLMGQTYIDGDQSMVVVIQENGIELDIFKTIDPAVTSVDNTFDKIDIPSGMTSTSTIQINCSVEFGDYTVYGCHLGQIFAHNNVTDTWIPYNDGTATLPISNGTALGTNSVLSMTVFDTYLIVAGAQGRVASFEPGVKWWNYNDLHSANNKNYQDSGNVVGSDDIISMEVMESIDELIIIGDEAKVGSFFNPGIGTGGFTDYLGVGSATIYYNPTAYTFLTTNAANCSVVMKPYHTDFVEHLVIGSDDGEIISCDNTNVWKVSAGPDVWDTFTAKVGSVYDIQSLVQYKGYLVAIYYNNYITCDWNGAWGHISTIGYGTDPLSPYYGDGATVSSANAGSYIIERKADFEYYMSENSNFVGANIHRNDLSNIKRPDLWTSFQADGTIDSTELYFANNTTDGQYMWDITATAADDTGCYIEEGLTNNTIATDQNCQILLKRGNVDTTKVEVYNQNYASVVATLLVDFSLQTVNATNGKTLSVRWFPDDIVQIHFHGSSQTSSNLLFRIWSNYGAGTGAIGAYTRAIRPMIMSQGNEFISPWSPFSSWISVDHASELQSHVIPTDFTIEMKFKPGFTHDTTSYKYLFYKTLAADKEIAIYYSSSDRFYFVYESGTSTSVYTDTLSGVDMNQNFRLFATYKNGVSIGIYLIREDGTFMSRAFSSGLKADPGFSNFYVGMKDATAASTPSESYIERVKIYDNVYIPEGTTQEELEAMFPESKIFNLYGYGHTSISEDNVVSESNSGDRFSGYVTTWSPRNTSFDVGDTIYNIENIGSVVGVDKATGSYKVTDKTYIK